MAFLTLIGGVVVGSIAVFLSTILSGWVLSILWMWFIVPTFGLPALSIPLAIATMIVTRFVTNGPTVPKKDDENDTMETIRVIAVSFVYPLFALLSGWIVKFFI